MEFRIIYCNNCKKILGRYNMKYYSDDKIGEVIKVSHSSHVKRGHLIELKREKKNSRKWVTKVPLNHVKNKTEKITRKLKAKQKRIQNYEQAGMETDRLFADVYQDFTTPHSSTNIRIRRN